eukprot:GILI01010040.1.p1 GENE.GILI01010040.1~~GILI01010040.1.p1  ORF type:complete len:547 (-),score=106.50 GILI01010040.1:423-2063(-)
MFRRSVLVPNVRRPLCVAALPVIPKFQNRSFRLVDPRPSETAAKLANGGAHVDMEHLQREILKHTTKRIDDQINNARHVDHLMDLVQFYSSMKPAKVNLNDIVVWLDNPKYDPYIHCHRQLPLLIAALIKGIGRMPEGLSSMPSIIATRKVLLESFGKLVALPVPVNVPTEQQFAKVIGEIVERHGEHDILMKMATGVIELKTHHNRHIEALKRLRSQHAALESQLDDNTKGAHGSASASASASSVDRLHTAFARNLLKIQEPLDAFNKYLVEFNFTARQMLDFADRMEQTEGNQNPPPNANCLTMRRPTEKISQLVPLADVVRDAVYDAKQICDGHYGDSPEVTYHILNAPVLDNAVGKHLAFSALQPEDDGAINPVASTESGHIYGHICPTVHYIIVELMKNAFRATIERHAKRNKANMLACDDVPPVKITINARPGLMHSCICVEDQGTGIKRDHIPYAMSYSFTTAKGVLSKEDEEAMNSGDPSATMNGSVGAVELPPLAGFGYGLPMSRTYARCFGGDVVLRSVEGSGTKVYLYLKAAAAQ